MAVNDLTEQNIQDTYQKVIQTDGTSVADGTGSLLPISFDGNNVIISGSLTATEYSVTSSVTNVVFQQQSGSTIFGDSSDDTHLFTGSLDVLGTITASSNISASTGYFSSILLPAPYSSDSSPHYGGRIAFDYSDLYGGHPRNYIEGNGSTITINAHSTLHVEADDEVKFIGSNNTVNQHISGSPRVFIGPFSKDPKDNDGTLTVWGSLATTSSVGHITASGNIIAVGNISASNGIDMSNNTSIRAHLTTGVIHDFIKFDASNVARFGRAGAGFTFIQGSDIRLEGSVSASNITSSGNISASGKLIGMIDGGKF